MNILKSYFDKQVTKALAQQIASLTIQHMGGVATYGDWSAAQQVKKAYLENVVVYSIIDRIAEKFGHLPRYVYNPKKEGKKFHKKHFEENMIDGDLSELLQRPNDVHSGDAFFYLVCTSYKLTGEAIIWKNRGGLEKGQPLELYVLPPWMVGIVTDGLFSIKEYVLQVGGQSIVIPKEDVIHWRKPSLSLDPATNEHLRGFNPLAPQRKTVQQSHDITDASVAMYQNGGAKGVLYNETLNDLDPNQQDTLKGVIDRKLNNPKVKAAIASVQGKWGYLNVGANSVDMELLEADELVTKKLCNANGLPFELFESGTTFANKEQAWYFFITNTLMPLAASFDATLNKDLTPDFTGEKGALIHTDFHELPEMQSMRLKQVQALSQCEELSYNEKRILGGFEPRKEAEMDMIWISPNKVPITEARIGAEMSNSNTEDYKPTK